MEHTGAYPARPDYAKHLTPCQTVQNEMDVSSDKLLAIKEVEDRGEGGSFGGILDIVFESD
jgi:hypothetical protein